MQLSGKIHLYFMILLICSAIIAIAGIYGFQRLEPSINMLNSSNTKSLFYAEQMFTNISEKKDLSKFEQNLNLAKLNITENGEEEVLNKISADYPSAFSGNKNAEEKVISDLSDLSKINRQAMEQAGINAKKQKVIGIWIILFPSVFIWIIGFALLKILDITFIKPIQELNNVIFDYNNGNHMRRCPSATISKDLQKLYDGINNILDNK